jgi:two-component system LytT family response regulator
MEGLKAILIDDEANSLENLQQKLQAFCPSINIIATTQRPEEAILLIYNHKPDVIFLDIEMPRMNGFKMIEELKEVDFEIVFITAYNHYAIDAIRLSAFDYLVKPVSVKDLQNCTKRLLENHNKHTSEKFDILRKSLNEPKSQEDKIAIPTLEGMDFIQVKNIIRIESSSNYSRIILINGKTILVTKLLKEFEEILLKYRFYRIHNSHLINLTCINKYIRGDGGEVVMQNGDVIDVARRKKEEFLKLISK